MSLDSKVKYIDEGGTLKSTDTETLAEEKRKEGASMNVTDARCESEMAETSLPNGRKRQLSISPLSDKTYTKSSLHDPQDMGNMTKACKYKNRVASTREIGKTVTELQTGNDLWPGQSQMQDRTEYNMAAPIQQDEAEQNNTSHEGKNDLFTQNNLSFGSISNLSVASLSPSKKSTHIVDNTGQITSCPTATLGAYIGRSITVGHELTTHDYSVHSGDHFNVSYVSIGQVLREQGDGDIGSVTTLASINISASDPPASIDASITLSSSRDVNTDTPSDQPVEIDGSVTPSDPPVGVDGSVTPSDPPVRVDGSVTPSDPPVRVDGSVTPSDPPVRVDSSVPTSDPPVRVDSSVTPSDPPVRVVGSVTPSDPPVRVDSSVTPSDPPVRVVGSVTPSDPPVRVVGSVTPSDPPVRVDSSVTPSDPPVRVVGNVTPSDPPVRVDSSVTPSDPPVRVDGSVTPSDPPVRVDGSVTPSDPPVRVDGSVTPSDPPVRVDGSVTPSDPPVRVDGSVTPSDPPVRVDGSVTPSDPPVRVDGSVTPSDPPVGVDGSVPTSDPPVGVDSSVTPSDPPVRVDGSVTPSDSAIRDDGNMTPFDEILVPHNSAQEKVPNINTPSSRIRHLP